MWIRLLERTFAIFLTSVLFASVSQGASAENCRRSVLKALLEPEITTPEIGGLPRIDHQELPAWLGNPINEDYAYTRYRYGFVQQPGGPAFEFVNEPLSGDYGPEVVEVSNERFKAAPDWGQLDEWLAERLDIASAPEYRHRSEYWVTRKHRYQGKPIRGSEVETTYGMTWGEYSRDDIEGKTAKQIYTNLDIRLPEEKTLQRPVQRYYDSRGKGIAIEFRAVSKDPLTTPSWLRDEGLSQMILGILDEAKRYPELYDKPIVTCYGDKRTIPLYEHWMNMKIQKETTPLDQPVYIHRKDGTTDQRVPWWYIEVSPRDLEKVLIDRKSGPRTIRNLNQPHPFKLPDGREVMAAEKAPISFDSNGNVTLATLERPTELEKGIIAEKGATAFWVDRHLVRVSSIHEPYAFNLGNIRVVAPSGSTLEWNHPFLVEWHKNYKRTGEFAYKPDFDGKYKDFILPDGRDLRLRAINEMDRLDISIYSYPSDDHYRPLLNARGSLVDPKLARVVSTSDHPIVLSDFGIQATEVESSGDTLSVRLARDFLTEDGLKAAAGSDLVLSHQGDKLIWKRIALSENCILNGISFKKGTLLIRDDTGIRAYSGRYQSQLYPTVTK